METTVTAHPGICEVTVTGSVHGAMPTHCGCAALHAFGAGHGSTACSARFIERTPKRTGGGYPTIVQAVELRIPKLYVVSSIPIARSST